MRIDPKIWQKAKTIVYISCGGFGVFAGWSVYKENEQFYDNILMPAVYKLNPEVAHRTAVFATKYKLFPKSKFQDPDTLKTEIWGLKFSNPVGIAAGFDKDAEGIETLHNIGFGFVEVGSVTPLPQPGNEKPRVFRLETDGAIINRYGFNSKGHQSVLDKIKEIKDQKEFNGIIGVNLGKNKTSDDPVKDYVVGIERFGLLADYLVINISSPNTPGLRQWQKKKHLEELLSALVSARNNLSTHKPPILLKLAPDLSKEEREDIAHVLLLEKCKVDGLVISNTTVNRPELTSSLATEQGGLSGKPLQCLSTQLISDMYTLTQGKIPIIGVGGVFTGQDAYDKIRAGASLVQLYTSFALHGPPRVTKVKKELDELLRRDGFKNLNEAVGAK